MPWLWVWGLGRLGFRGWSGEYEGPRGLVLGILKLGITQDSLRLQTGSLLLNVLSG